MFFNYERAAWSSRYLILVFTINCFSFFLQLFVLLRQLNGKEASTGEEGLEQLSEREKILHDEFEKLEFMKEELEKRDDEIRELKSKIALAEFDGCEVGLIT